MGILAGISGKRAVKCFVKFGYCVVRQKGSHMRLKHPVVSQHKALTIPSHKELKLGLLTQLIKDAGITVEEFLDLM
ncbi:MAG: type II toxin-antitoxin system HicA family toxin [Candidatus Magasanikbacteria bacterium]|nr:type II toxin-antitoxin system HicA family toxin [Candidatus Magasanikbacteria bacterium]